MNKLIVTNKLVKNYSKNSGDFNPIHIDSKFSSTSLFGQRIAHGALVLAIVLKRVLKKEIIHDLKCFFFNPVFINEELIVKISTVNEKKIILVKDKKLQILLKIIVVVLNKNSKEIKEKYLINTVLKKRPTKPILRSKKDIIKIIKIDMNLLIYSKKQFFSLRDNLFLFLEVVSREIGMNYPGKNSLFLNCQIQFNKNLLSQKNYFKILKFNKLTSVIDIEYKLGKFIGIAKSILLPEYKKNLIFKRKFVIKNKCNKKILILGGSRGLGLFTTKLLLNSNYNVVSTYNLNDENLRKLMKIYKKNLKIKKINVLNKMHLKKVFHSKLDYDFIFNFTTCKILKSSNVFDHKYYKKLEKFYLEPIKFFFKNYKNFDKNTKFFIPSTTYINEQDKKKLFQEYTLAKLNAEKLAKKLNVKKKIFYSFRLNEYDTDQHYSFIPKKINNDISSLVNLLKKFLN